MFKILRSITYSALFLFFTGSVFASEMPFTDVSASDPYYSAVVELYNGQIIADNGDHLFRPKDLMSRDFFVSLAVGIGCHKCETPSIDDIIKYRVSPFVDLTKSNRYYYCIAYAGSNNIALGYTPDSSGKASCENKKQYMSSPFCPENTITRIEATAILLRQAKLWNDTLNSGNFDKNLSIPDVTSYWYGYAKKGIEMGIIKQDSSGKIGQDEKITRGEFAIMSAHTLRYTQCQTSNIDNTVEAGIGIYDENGRNIHKGDFAEKERFSLAPIIQDGNWGYIWIAQNPNTGEVITVNGNRLPESTLSSGNWIITLRVSDLQTKKIVSEPHITINIGTSKDTYLGDIGIKNQNGEFLNGNTFSVDTPITLVSTSTGSWDYIWEATNDTGKVVTGQGKELPGSKLGKGTWTVILTTRELGTGKVVDTDTRKINIISGAITPSGSQDLSVIIHADPLVSNLGKSILFTSESNSNGSGIVYKWDFGDGTIIDGTGSKAHTYTKPGTYSVILTVLDQGTGNISQSDIIIRVTGDRDTDSDGISDDVDQCPFVYSKTTNGCPSILTYGDKTTGNISGNGQSDNQFGNNTCITEKQKSQGLLIGTPNCTQCPCKNKISIDAPLRPCDIVFPTILSSSLDTVYARGGFYLIP